MSLDSMGTNGKDYPPEQAPDSNLLEHFLYFPEKSHAETAGERLRAKGWTVKIARAASSTDWLVLATEYWPNEEKFEQTRQELESLAEELGGRYDGWGGPG